jgi:50S ribosomal protein L16 3-hydroxylase
MQILQNFDCTLFLAEYWQKKPLVIKNALGTNNLISPEILAGFSLEDAVESRIVIHTPEKNPSWKMLNGPFTEATFKKLPETHWTLLVNGVDRLAPKIYELIQYFTFIPQWRFDDVMVSYATEQGSVGPHYDNYDVFLFQGMGQRKWSLTSQNCDPENYLPNIPLRIMKEFHVEQEYILNEGDLLYLPPHIAHHGVSLSKDCMTYSFGYRSYQTPELWQNFGDYLGEQINQELLLKDPLWQQQAPGLIPAQAWQKVKATFHQLIDNEELLRTWFGNFVTSLTRDEEELIPCWSPPTIKSLEKFFNTTLNKHKVIIRTGTGRLAYQESPFAFFLNGYKDDIPGIDENLIRRICNNEKIPLSEIKSMLSIKANIQFLQRLHELGCIFFAQN